MDAKEEFLMFRDRLKQIYLLHIMEGNEKEVAYELGCLQVTAHNHYHRLKNDEFNERTEK